MYLQLHVLCEIMCVCLLHPGQLLTISRIKVLLRQIHLLRLRCSNISILMILILNTVASDMTVSH